MCDVFLCFVSLHGWVGVGVSGVSVGVEGKGGREGGRKCCIRISDAEDAHLIWRNRPHRVPSL